MSIKPPTHLEAIWAYDSTILATTLDDHGALSSLVYSGQLKVNGQERGVLRRLLFSSAGLSIAWEYQFNEDPYDEDRYGRLDDLVFIPADNGGLLAIDLVSGERRWELGHTSSLHKAPLLLDNGALLLVFQDQSWVQCEVSTGAVRESGQVKSDTQAEALMKGGRSVFPNKRSEESTSYQNASIHISGGKLRVENERGNRDERAPKPGEYPIEDWQADDYLAVIDQKLVVWLERKWGHKQNFALGLFALPSLEPLALLQLGAGRWSADCDETYLADGLLALKTELLISPEGNNTDEHKPLFVVDIKRERIVAVCCRDRDSFLFGPDGQSAWRGWL